MIGNRLKRRIVLMISLLFFTANLFTFLLVRKSTKLRFYTFIERNDRMQAQAMSDFLSRSWDSPFVEEGFHWMDRPMMDHMRQMGHMGRGRGSGPLRPFAILDHQGKVIYSGYEQNPESFDLDRAEPIEKDGEVVGYVFTGPQGNLPLSPDDRRFLASINRIYVFTTVLFTLLGLVLAYYFILLLFRPLERIYKATQELRQGNTEARTGLEGKDEIAQLGHSFDLMAQSLEEAQCWKEQIIADSAHELRTPTAVLLGHLEMIREGIYSMDSQRLDILYKQTKSLSVLIENMQLLASVESPRIHLNREDIDIPRFLKDIEDGFFPLLKEKDLHLQWNIPEEGHFHADPQRIRQVWNNLLSNAIFYSPQGKVIEISAMKSQKGYYFSVEDQGPGIPLHSRDSVFQRFYRTDGSRNKKDGGQGLGLAIAKAIVDAHGGQIGVEDSPLGGAKIWFLLPFS